MRFISNHKFIDRAKELVERGECMLAVSQLSDFLSGSDDLMYSEAKLLMSRIADIDTRRQRGLLGASVADIHLRSISKSLMAFVGEISHKFTSDQLPIPSKDVSFELPDEGVGNIVGADVVKNMQWLKRGFAVAKGVCRVVTSNGLASGFLINGNRIVTANSVIPNRETAAETRVEFNFEEDDGGILEPVVFSLKPTTLRTDPEINCSVIEVEENSALDLREFGFLELHRSEAPAFGDHLAIIHHPQGGLKQMDVMANRVVKTDNHRLHYVTSISPGSVGSPIFNNSWRVVALHSAGGNMVKNNRGDRMFANEGILLSHFSALNN